MVVENFVVEMDGCGDKEEISDIINYVDNKRTITQPTGPTPETKPSSLIRSDIESILGNDRRRLDVYQALISKDIKWAGVYLGAIKVLQDCKNPDRFSLCAHNIRELLDFLLGGKEPSELGNKVKDLEDSFISKNISNKIDGLIAGSDSPLEQGFLSFLQKIQEFFSWVEEKKPKKKDRAENEICRLDATSSYLPKELLRTQVRYVLNYKER